ncbi:hypothetical protein [Deinococcus marmoris]|uniref:hypothetical protein n=1 Tax=Deinococcus marmoris TaxID=249408 RepID=UPI00096AC3AA|nr:hypothetical protein [Deinococcus marmoris]
MLIAFTLPFKHGPGTYMTWLATQGCVCCGVKPVVLHHLAVWGLPRKLRNPLRDYVVVSVCPHHHDDTGDRQAAHRMAQDAWLSAWGYPDADTLLLAALRAYSAAHGLVPPPRLGAQQLAQWLRDTEAA